MSFWDEVKQGWQRGLRAPAVSIAPRTMSARKHPDDLKETIKLQAQVQKLWDASPLAELDLYDVIIDILRHSLEIADRDDLPTEEVLQSFIATTQDLLFLDGLTGVPDPDWSEELTMTEGVNLRNHLYAQRRFLTNYKRYFEIWTDKLAYLYAGIFGYLPDSCFVRDDEDDESEDAQRFPIPLLSAVTDLAECIERTTATFQDDDVRDTELFSAVYKQLVRNTIIASGMNPDLPDTHTKQPIHPTQQKKMESDELLTMYLSGTPLTKLFEGNAALVIPDSVKFEHTHIVGGSGHGKTQLLQQFIKHDLERFDRREGGFAIIDSQGDLIDLVSRQKSFSPYAHPSGEGERIIIIDPKDIEHPPCLNMFDLGLENLGDIKPADRIQIINTALELFEYMFGALLGTELTGRQGVIFRYIAQLMMVVPNANIMTLMDFLEHPEQYSSYFSKLNTTARRFFLELFLSDRYKSARQQLVERVFGVLSTPMFEAMFDNKRNKVNIADAMNTGKVILINTSKNFFGETGCQIFGRFWLALFFQATLTRETIKEKIGFRLLYILTRHTTILTRNLKRCLCKRASTKLAV